MFEYRAFLIKYAEIGVKGKNRYLFEDALVGQIANALKKIEGDYNKRYYRDSMLGENHQNIKHRWNEHKD